MSHLSTIKHVLTKKFYPLSFILFSLAYLAINVIANKLYISIQTLYYYAWYISIPFTVLTLLNALLVGLTLNLLIHKYRVLRRISKASALSGVGAAGGLLVGACPGCIVGVFPAVLGLFGSNMALIDLPLYGIEILFVSAVLLIWGSYLLTRPDSCKR